MFKYQIEILVWVRALKNQEYRQKDRLLTYPPVFSNGKFRLVIIPPSAMELIGHSRRVALNPGVMSRFDRIGISCNLIHDLGTGGVF